METYEIANNGDSDKNKDFENMLSKAFQSANINFLIGSGASLPSIPTAGDIEKEIEDLYEKGGLKEAESKVIDFLWGIQEPTNHLINKGDNQNNEEAVQNYQKLIKNIETLLVDRSTQLLSKQANIFTTNYDLLIEKAAESAPTLLLNDGFSRAPSLDNKFVFSSKNFFTTIFNTGNLYGYKVEIPTINLIKMHGSLSWVKNNDQILFGVTPKSKKEIQEEHERYAIVLPRREKFQETLIEQTYYDLLRIYSNELDKENTLLIVFGFSFIDEHLLGITKRALKNPTLKMIIFSYSHDIVNYESKFNDCNNVTVAHPEKDEHIDFNMFNSLLNINSTKFGEN